MNNARQCDGEQCNLSSPIIYLQSNEVVWVNKRYVPIELRSTAPVPRHKLLNNKNITSESIATWRRPIIEPPIHSYKRQPNESLFQHSSPAYQCQEWSTLRQMLGSRGVVVKKSPPLWGTNQAEPNTFDDGRRCSRFPVINSPMTSYVDAMHVTNRLFTLHWFVLHKKKNYENYERTTYNQWNDLLNSELSN